jgi:hypothetical protein
MPGFKPARAKVKPVGSKPTADDKSPDTGGNGVENPDFTPEEIRAAEAVWDEIGRRELASGKNK